MRVQSLMMKQQSFSRLLASLLWLSPPLLRLLTEHQGNCVWLPEAAAHSHHALLCSLTCLPACLPLLLLIWKPSCKWQAPLQSHNQVLSPQSFIIASPILPLSKPHKKAFHFRRLARIYYADNSESSLSLLPEWIFECSVVKILSLLSIFISAPFYSIASQEIADWIRK